MESASNIGKENKRLRVLPGLFIPLISVLHCLSASQRCAVHVDRSLSLSLCNTLWRSSQWFCRLMSIARPPLHPMLTATLMMMHYC